MHCHEEPALKLAAFALQAEKGDYDHQKNRYGYFRPEDYLPQKASHYTASGTALS